VFISNRPLSAVLAALAAAAAFVVTDELYRQHSERMTEAEKSAAPCRTSPQPASGTEVLAVSSSRSPIGCAPSCGSFGSESNRGLAH